MKRFVLMVFLLWAIFAVMIVAACGYGEAHPQPDKLAELGFGVCDGNPCFPGIVPGVTTWDEARGKLLTRTDIWKDDENLLDGTYLGQSIAINRDGNFITIIFDEADPNYSPDIPISIAQLIDLYGIPCQVTLKGDIELRYPGMIAHAIVNG